MTFVHPVWLFGLVAVGAAAVWAFFRPTQRLRKVAALGLWRKTLESFDRSSRRRWGAFSAGWLLLLLGAIAALLAAAGPVWRNSLPGRRVIVAVYPSVELRGDGGAELRTAVNRLLDRLSAADRVRLIRPVLQGGASEWLSPAQARTAVDSLPILPVAVDDLALPSLPSPADAAYCFAPVGTDIPVGPDIYAIMLPSSLPDVTLDALAAAMFPDGKVQLFVALRNQTSRPQSAVVRVVARRSKWEFATIESSMMKIPAGGRWPIILMVSPAEAYDVSVVGQSGAGAEGYLVRRAAVQKKLAILGRDDPLLRRFVKVDPTLVLVADVDEADLVIANATAAPAGKPAIIINPPEAPPGWQKVASIGPLILAEADRSADDLLLQDVNLDAVAVRRVAPWTPSTEYAALKRVVGYGKDALILRTTGETQADSASPRRLYVAFSVSGENTNFAMSEAMVIFLANTVRWLSPGTGVVAYGYVTPLRAGINPDWHRVGGLAEERSAGLLWPGIYRDSEDGWHAVSLIGLKDKALNEPPQSAVADLPLPAPMTAVGDVSFWPWLALAAILFWLIGWRCRARGR